MNPFSIGVKNKKVPKKSKAVTTKKENIENGLEEYYNNQNFNLNDNVQEKKKGIESLLKYFSEYKREQLQTKRDLNTQDYYIESLIHIFDELIEVFESNNSKNFMDVKKKIIKNLNEILIPKIGQLTREIDRNIRQKEIFESIISSINYKSKIPPMTMNQFIPPNSPRGEISANYSKENINQWPVVGAKGYPYNKPKRTNRYGKL
jgi:hypothetical protein